MNKHVKIAGWLNLVIGLFGAVLGLVFMLKPDAVTYGGWIGEEYLLVFWLGAVAAALSLLYIIGGVGLIKGWRWARFLAAALIVVSLWAFPFGTAIGLYTFWALVRSGRRRRRVELGSSSA